MPTSDIIIRGAREHNLQNVSLSLPRNKLIVMTGVSGSGKSSLAFDTLYAEGQRRYVESLSTYARQFLGQMPKPDVDAITGLAPSISIQQKSTSRNPRSTVGTITEIHDYLRVLFARVGQGYCYVSGKPIQAQSTDQIIDSLLAQPAGTRFQILAPLVQNQKGEFRDLFEDLQKKGFLRARIDGQIVALADAPALRRHHKHNIEVVIDRITAGPGQRSRVAEAVEQALKLADGRLICSTDSNRPASPASHNQNPELAGIPASELVAEDSPPITRQQSSRDRLYSAKYACAESGMSYEPPSPQLFSFNSPLGMCLDCNGLGMRHGFPLHNLIVDDQKSIQKGAILLLDWSKLGRWPKHILAGAAQAIEEDCGLPADSLLKTKWKDIPEPAKKLWLHGTGNRHVTFTWRTRGGAWKHGGTWEGWVNRLLESWRTAANPMRRRQLEKHMEVATCTSCEGERLNKQARNVRIRTASTTFARSGKPQELSLPEVCALSVEDAAEFFKQLVLDPVQQLIAEEALREIRGRLGFLLQCGLGYLSLERSAPTLSGGESQRIRLAGQIGCGLVGVVYILDEPSIGLHPRDNTMLLSSLQRLRDQGNTVIVVEHDEETMRAADHIVDFGPGPGILGGEVVAEGSVDEILKSPRSVTGQFLSGRQTIDIPDTRRSPDRGSLVVHNARHNNLKHVTAEFPLGRLICVTGVSGSGKSSLVNDILWQVVNRDVNGGIGEPGLHDRIDGLELIDKAIDIDQSPIGRTPRSNPATYVKVFDEIRKLFTQLPQSKIRGYKDGRFSFNVEGGRCEACEGHGATKLEMDFLADIWVPCNVCEGRRFNRETLEVRFRDKSIADVLNLEVREALELFDSFPKITQLLRALRDVGLDYMQLGQASPTLSGGEAQRIKLARELGKRSTGKTLYLLDEPTTGLHFADVKKLIEVLHNFVNAGNTVIVIEHNLDVIKTSDWLIDIGPEGGAGGGQIVAQGTPETVAKCKQSHTGAALRTVLPGFRNKKTSTRKATPKKNADPFVLSQFIHISGAAQHNLQKISVDVPREKLSVFCGPSGSGKSSLAMDTLYAEGQRRYVESLSSYARQFLGQMPRPKVESIHGLSPAIAIEQKTVGATPRSTVGTVTEIYDYLRVLFARLGQPYCPHCQQPAVKQTTDQIVDSILQLKTGSRLLLTAPLEIDRTVPFTKLRDRLREDGFARVRIDGITCDLDQFPELDHRRQHQIAIVVDRIAVDPKQRSRIADSVEAALDPGKGVLLAVLANTEKPEPEWQTIRYSLHLSCPSCQRSFEPQTPQKFSFNSPLGWCKSCEGLGREFGANQALLISSPERSLRSGAVAAWPNPQTNPHFALFLEALAETFQLPLDEPWYRLTPQQQRLVLYGNEDRWVELSAERQAQLREPSCTPGPFRFRYRGLYPAIEAASRLSFSHRRSLVEMAGERDCSACHGSRLEAEAAAVRLRGLTLPQFCQMPLAEALTFLQNLKLTREEKRIAGDLLNEATHRLTFLVDVGLDYLTLGRAMPSLSGGESQRIRLAGQAGRSLTGVLYVLDEPTIGLHPRDNNRLLAALKRLRDLGNTVLLVEHDREVLDAADHLYDFGPGAGRLGGSVTAHGQPADLRRNPRSLTGAYLSGKRDIPVPQQRRIQVADWQPDGRPIFARTTPSTAPTHAPALELLGAAQHNLQRVNLCIPLRSLTCITGVSGSGKSSLMMDTLAPAVARKLSLTPQNPGPFSELHGFEHLSRIITVDQNPIGTTPASNPATYVGLFDEIRDLFCRMPEARVRGFKPGRFSFNKPGGRCEDCEGMGQKKIEMHFLPDVWVECPTCRGKRFNTETLTVRFNDCSIADVLDMSVSRALELFANVPRIRTPLATLDAIGLGYLTLGQPAPTLSGGEAQRIKLAAELCRPNRGRTLYLLDEPTTGLHFDDILKLLSVLNSLVEQGNTVVVIEHNLDVIKTADWIVDLGPEAGVGGGTIVVQGTPEDVVKYAVETAAEHQTAARTKKSNPKLPPRSWTGELLAPVLKQSQHGEIAVFNAASLTEKRSGDLSIEELGRAAKFPWETNGRRWHTQDRLSHNGQPCHWDGEALNYVVDLLAKSTDLSPANWNDRATVEVRPAKGLAWFLHARTGGEWLLALCFRVRKDTFDAATLDAELGLPPLDDMKEIPVYSSEPRVRVRNLKTAWQEVTIQVWKKSEIDTPAFRSFLNKALRSCLQLAQTEAANPDDLMPWKKLGRRWHLLRKGLPNQFPIEWNFELLEKLLPTIEEHLKNFEVNYQFRSKITWSRPNNGPVVAELHTKRAEAVNLCLYCKQGEMPLGSITLMADERSLESEEHRDVITLSYIRVAAAVNPSVKEILTRVIDHLV
jgi:excinuclease ABC subunit A